MSVQDARGASHVEFRSIEPSCPGWTVKQGLYVTFRRELSPDHDVNLKAIPRKQRAVVRKGIDYALTAKFGHDWRTLHAVYGESVRNLGTPVLPARYFALCCARSSATMREVLVIEDADEMRSHRCSASISRDEVLPYYGASRPYARHRAGNDILYRRN